MMIDPRTQYIIYKHQENERMRQTEQKLAASERGERVEIHQPWYAAIQWFKERIFSREKALADGSYKNKPTTTENPCQEAAQGCR